MTLQELFDLTWDHFVVNKAPPSYDAANGFCRYRGPDGTRCAIGLAIPDEMYTPEMDRVGGVGLVSIALPELFPSLFPGVAIGDLAVIQSCHDRAASLGEESWTGEEFTQRIEERLRKAAGELGLRIPEVVA